MSRRRQLSDEDRALWSGFAHSIKPLRRAKIPNATEAAKPAGAGEKAAAPPRAEARAQSPPPAKSPPLAALDRRLKQRVARGRDAIDVRIDLHGMTQSEAHGALRHFLREAQANGAKIALVVTGKGTRMAARDGSSERGVLKRQVPMWLALPEFRPFIVGFDDAHVSHGGQGALYVRLRRPR
jgi:DNA-nicking Smr family endonuclease